MDKQKDSVKKAVKEYLKEAHNRMLKSYHAKHTDIERAILNVDFNNFLKGNGKLVDDKRVNEILKIEQKRFQEDVYKIIQKDMRESWVQGNRMFDNMIQTAYITNKNRTPDLFKWDMKSWERLKNRQLFSGRTLSGRIWTLSNAYKREILDVLQIGVLNGDSAADLSRRLARYSLYANDKLADINNLTDKEVRDAVARRNTSKKGSMGTVLKDAKRLAGNESNIAFRESENSRMQSYFVLGFKINLSNAHPREDICDYVNGDYPKWFKWNGWHISCLCYRTFILMSLEDQRAYQKAIRQGKKPKIKGLIEDVPAGFKQYMSEHYEQMNSWKSKPYFMIDNDIPSLIK